MCKKEWWANYLMGKVRSTPIRQYNMDEMRETKTTKHTQYAVTEGISENITQPDDTWREFKKRTKYETTRTYFGKRV